MIMDPTQTKSTEDSPMGPGFTGGTLSAVGLITKINELTKHEDLLDGLVAFKELEAGTNQQVTALFEEYCHHVACYPISGRPRKIRYWWGHFCSAVGH